MGVSDVGGGWGGGPGGQSDQGPTGVHRTSQIGSIPTVGDNINPLHISYPMTTGQGDQPGSAEPATPARDIMRVTLLIPEDEYETWRSSRPEFVRIIETKILDKNERDLFGFK